MVVALHRRRCPLLVFRIFPLLPYIRRASSRHLGLVGSSSLALPPLFGCLFRYNFSSFDSGVVSRLRAIETRTGVSILRMQGLVGSFRHGCRDRLVSRRGTLHCSLRRGPLNFLRSLSSLAPLASAGPLLGVRWSVGSCGRLGDLFVTGVSDTAGLGSGESGAKFKRPVVAKQKKQRTLQHPLASTGGVRHGRCSSRSRGLPLEA